MDPESKKSLTVLELSTGFKDVVFEMWSMNHQPQGY